MHGNVTLESTKLLISQESTNPERVQAFGETPRLRGEGRAVAGGQMREADGREWGHLGSFASDNNSCKIKPSPFPAPPLCASVEHALVWALGTFSSCPR